METIPEAYSPLGGISRAGGPGSSHAAFARIAEERGGGCPARELAESRVVVPIPGPPRPATIRDSAAAADPTPNEAEFAELDAASGMPQERR
ncbi:hypothetical protein [Streptomyces atratus]|uniref:Uncharacterized protein n=1 Tax=Streptomyces atratus TaxID=1893 RepID=A0A2Z5JBE5_STRAR|nr:hypothetical protein C5746_12820 [Streptomyces atratus]